MVRSFDAHGERPRASRSSVPMARHSILALTHRLNQTNARFPPVTSHPVLVSPRSQQLTRLCPVEWLSTWRDAPPPAIGACLLAQMSKRTIRAAAASPFRQERIVVVYSALLSQTLHVRGARLPILRRLRTSVARVVGFAPFRQSVPFCLIAITRARRLPPCAPPACARRRRRDRGRTQILSARRGGRRSRLGTL
jgi:hypothetical protein